MARHLFRLSDLRSVCATCKHSARKCSGPCPCTIDGADIMQHAQERYCPLGKYKLGLGDVIAIITHRTGIQWLLRKISRKPTCGGCKGRQIKLNQLKEV